MTDNTNVVLVGMPGAGKSTIGVLLAKQLALNFVDTDLLIQIKYGRELQQILNKQGYLKLREIEEEVICELNCQSHVIATGGSAVYSQRAMEHLKRNSLVVFLHVDFKEIVKRVKNFDSRGIAMRPTQTFLDLFNERLPLYQRYADILIDCRNKHHDAVTAEICHQLDLQQK